MALGRNDETAPALGRGPFFVVVAPAAPPVGQNLDDDHRERARGQAVTPPTLSSTWLRRQVPSWACVLAVCAFALAALVEGASPWGTAVAVVLLLVDGIVGVGVVAVLVRYRRQIFLAAARDEVLGDEAVAAPDPVRVATTRRLVRAEGLVLGALCVFAGLDAAYTVHPAAVGIALLIFGVQMLYDRHRRAVRR